MPFLGPLPWHMGGSQARGLIGAVAASLHYRHSNTGSEPPLQPIPQVTAMPYHYPTEQGQGLKPSLGVPVVAQWLTNPTRNHEVAGSVPALAHWVNDPALP